jgi:hypothetical protein
VPKRTNPFQSLVAQVYKARKEDNAVVIESGEVGESGTSTPAEIDILIRKTTFGHEVVIALECRDHQRPQSVEWIRELADKKRSMPIDKMFAVSTSGFTEKAREKAKANGIELLTLRAAESLDFGAQLLRLGMCDIQWTLRFQSVTVAWSDPKQQSKVCETSILEIDGEAPQFDMKTLIESVLRNNADQITAAFHQSLPQAYKVRADLDRDAYFLFPIQFKKEARINGVAIDKLWLQLLCKPMAKEVGIDHYSLGDSRIAHSILDAGDKRVSITATHWKDQQGKLSISISPVNSPLDEARVKVKVSPTDAAKTKPSKRKAKK